MANLRPTKKLLIIAWVGVLAGASGRVVDLLPGQCADGIGCIFSVGLITSWLAVPIVLGVSIAVVVSACRRSQTQSEARRFIFGAVSACAATVVVALSNWFFPYWPRY